MSRSYLRSTGALEHSLIHELRPELSCDRDGVERCATDWAAPDELGITDDELIAALMRRGYPRRRAWVAVQRWSWILGKEEPVFRRLDRRRHRKQANRLTRLGRADEIVEPPHTQGWQTW